MNRAARFLLPILLLLPSCAVALVGAGAAVGIWAYDENSKESGEIVLPYPPEQVFAAAHQVADARGSEVVAIRGSMRIECEVEGASVIFQVLMVPDRHDVARLKVRATSVMGLRGHSELAKDLAMSVEDRLK